MKCNRSKIHVIDLSYGLPTLPSEYMEQPMNKKTRSAAPSLIEPHPESIYLNRELSQLAFNRRVLAQAEDSRLPLLERLRYLCIVSSNLDEFFEVRLASLLAHQRMQGEQDESSHPVSYTHLTLPTTERV